MNNNQVYLATTDGTIQTDINTLKKIPYFKALFDEKPKLMGPKLNFLQLHHSSKVLTELFTLVDNPIHMYDPKIKEDLEYYTNFKNYKTTGGEKISFDKITFSKPSENNTLFSELGKGLSGQETYLTGGAQITFHKEIYRRHTECLFHINTEKFNKCPWSIKFDANNKKYILTNFKILIPSTITISKLKKFRVVVKTYDCTHMDLDLDMLYNLGYCKTHGNYHSFDLASFIKIKYPIAVLTKSDFTISLTCEPEFQNLKTMLKYYQSSLNECEKNKFTNQLHEYLIVNFRQNDFIDKKEFILPCASIKGIIWETSEKLDKVCIESDAENNKNFKLELDQYDFQNMVAEDLEIKDLKNNWGIAKFNHNNNFHITQPSGCLPSKGKYKIVFPKKVSGRITIIFYNVMWIAKGKSGFLYHNYYDEETFKPENFPGNMDDAYDPNFCGSGFIYE
jgi:hypothetical protein